MASVGGCDPVSWIGEQYPGYFEICKLAVEYASIYRHFKSHPEYRWILEHCSFEDGQRYLERINTEFPSAISGRERSYYLTNDQIGGPITYDYGNPMGWISPSTLRYIMLGADIVRRFANVMPLWAANILEIGPGYGGQCKILHDMTKWRSYAIIDDPRVEPLTFKYLQEFNIQAHSHRHMGHAYDLVISNYAFSEFNDELQRWYYENCLATASHAFLLCTAPVIPEVLAKATAREPENPLLNPDNYLLTW